MTKISRGTIETIGKGKPDYTREVSSALQRPGLVTKYDETQHFGLYLPTDYIVHPYPIPWVLPVLAPGAIAHLVDSDTGIAYPYTVAAGYGLSAIELQASFNQDVEVYVFFDGFLITCLAVLASGTQFYAGPIVGYSTLAFDPLALLPHVFDVQVVNRGAGNMRGEMTVSGLLEAVGTPPFPTEKDCLCPFCKTINHVGIKISEIKCHKCGNTFRVTNYGASPYLRKADKK